MTVSASINGPAPVESVSLAASPRRWRVLAVAAVAQYLAILDLFAVTVAFPTLQTSFGHASASTVSWVLNAYTIVMAALLVPAGRLADDTGRKRGFLLGIALFGLASVACAAAPGLGALIAARVVQAAAAALLVPTGLGLVLPSFDAREHPTVMGIWTAIAAAGAGSGPVIGGLLLQAGWRWIFLLNIPFTVAAFLFGLRVLPDIRGQAGRKLDLFGATLILAATAALTTAFVQASDWGYTSPATVGALLAASALAGTFGRHVRRHPDPVVSPAVLRHKLFRIATAGVFAYYLAFAALILEATLFLTQQWHYSQLTASLGIAPIPISCLLLSPLSGRLVARIGARACAALGGATIALGAAWWIATAGLTTSYPIMFLPGAILAGASTALLQPPLFGASALLPADQLSLGSGTLMMARQTSSALGVAILTAILARAVVPGLGDYRAGWVYMVAVGLLAAVAGLAYRPGAPAQNSTAPRRPGQP
ncbi:MFS transporter [Nocardia vaccinii]|uniref:MFS transporter n=1 Tax=Nocardia vaccinii TaxID=1822 RepID=UPI000A0459D6|nr:MFS transporter [Nocardia vaccinii]